MIKMGLFEALATVSVALGLAIPVFMDKVMRPRYEERFYEYRTENRERLVEGLQESLDKLKKTARSKQELDPEITTSLESLVTRLERFSSEENKLGSLLKWRKILFVGWMLSLALSSLSIKFSERIVFGQTTLGEAAIAIFIFSLIASVLYVWELFELDEKLSRFGGKGYGESLQMPARGIIKERELEQNILQILKEWGIPFEKAPPIMIGSKFRVKPDFVVPAAKEPKYFIETRLNLRSSTELRYLKHFGEDLKRYYPGVKTILITKVPSLPPSRNNLSGRWDFIIDIDNLKELKRIIQIKR